MTAEDPTFDTPMDTTDKPAKAEKQATKDAKVTFKLAFGKQVSDLSLPTSTTIGELKEQVEQLTSIHPNMQKLLYKGQLNTKPDSMTLAEASVINGARIILMASKVEEILAVASGKPKKSASSSTATTAAVEKWRDMTEHKKVLAKGKPDFADIEPGLIGNKLPLPSTGWIVAINKYGHKTRLSFKGDEVWIATSERTQKVPLQSVQSATSQPHDDSGEYHIVALQLGPTEASRYFLYWVPCQYVTVIEDMVNGTFNTFL